MEEHCGSIGGVVDAYMRWAESLAGDALQNCPLI
jgi:hypothetical protein